MPKTPPTPNAPSVPKDDSHPDFVYKEFNVLGNLFNLPALLRDNHQNWLQEVRIPVEQYDYYGYYENGYVQEGTLGCKDGSTHHLTSAEMADIMGSISLQAAVTPLLQGKGAEALQNDLALSLGGVPIPMPQGSPFEAACREIEGPKKRGHSR